MKRQIEPHKLQISFYLLCTKFYENQSCRGWIWTNTIILTLLITSEQSEKKIQKCLENSFRFETKELFEKFLRVICLKTLSLLSHHANFAVHLHNSMILMYHVLYTPNLPPSYHLFCFGNNCLVEEQRGLFYSWSPGFFQLSAETRHVSILLRFYCHICNIKVATVSNRLI